MTFHLGRVKANVAGQMIAELLDVLALASM
jgi:hypothetical protein